MSATVKVSLLNFLVFLSISQAAWAADPSAGKIHYANGMEAYKAGNYAVCADELYLALMGDAAKDNQAALYLAHCQDKLNSSKFAAYNLNRVNAFFLNDADVTLYDALSEKYDGELSGLNPVRGWVMPYVATLGYSSNSSKKSAFDTGVAFGFSKRSWAGDFTVERLSMKMRTASTADYNQTQVGGGVTKAFLPSFWARANVTYLNTDSSTLGSAWVLGATANYLPVLGTALSLDYQHSSYPKLSLGSFSAHQITAAVDQALWSTLTQLFHAKFGIQSIFATAPRKVDPSSSFDLRSSYFRYFLDLEMRLTGWVFGAQGWVGKEAFGVRNQGSVIYNAYEEHRFGYGAKLGYWFTSSILTQAAYAVEGYNASRVDSTSNVASLGVSYNF